jgi:hypothetical protein
MNFRGFRGKVTFFVSEVDFENVVKVLGFAYVFENGKKCHVLLCSCFFVFLCAVANLSEKKFDSVYPVKGLETGGRSGGRITHSSS